MVVGLLIVMGAVAVRFFERAFVFGSIGIVCWLLLEPVSQCVFSESSAGACVERSAAQGAPLRL